VVGEAGIGKSRLARGFVESVGSKAKVITGRSPAYGEGITFLPLRQAVLEAAGPRGWPAIAELLAAEGDGARLARPDLLERRPGWQRTHTLFLEPLSVSETEELLFDRAGAVPPETLKRIVMTARGNPLFAEQLLATFDDAAVDAVPASLHGRLTMRLDRLGPGERDVLRCRVLRLD
jgi:predicted ATPase